MQQQARLARSRSAVSDAVVALVAESGLASVTVDAVARRSGVAKTTIYRHWPHASHMLADVLSTALPDPDVPDTGSLHSDLTRLARGLAAGLSDDRFAALLAAIAFPDGDPELDAVRFEATRARHAAVRTVVERARRRGETIPVDGADGIIRSIAGPLFYRRFVEGAAPTRQQADRSVARALGALPVAASDRGGDR
jgi:AcrR family transcriptional regulator